MGPNLAESAPHTRGCSEVRRGVRGRRGVCPAHAGVLRSPRWRTRRMLRPPRTRGGAPAANRAARPVIVSAPHTRGCSAGAVRAHRDIGVRPAHAGVLRSRTRSRGRGCGPPRTRGGAPSDTSLFSELGRSAPHTRGCSVKQPRALGGDAVRPAHAGVLRHGCQAVVRAARPPRTRGGAPIYGGYPPARPWSAPHTRGCSGDASEDQIVVVVRPAHAGVLRILVAYARASGRPPRTRGGAPQGRPLAVDAVSSAPHTRGCSPGPPARGRRRLVRPAHAGVLRQRRAGGPAPRSPPRTRGGAPRIAELASATDWSAPHTRGCSGTATPPRSGRTVRPAHAGVLRRTRLTSRGRGGPPRTRGGAPQQALTSRGATRSAPHTRGCSDTGVAEGYRGRVLANDTPHTRECSGPRLDPG